MYYNIKFFILLKYYLKVTTFEMRDISSPLNQFEIRDLFSLDAPILGNLHISITNIGFYLTIGAFFLLVINLLSTNYNKLVSNN